MDHCMDAFGYYCMLPKTPEKWWQKVIRKVKTWIRNVWRNV